LPKIAIAHALEVIYHYFCILLYGTIVSVKKALKFKTVVILSLCYVSSILFEKNLHFL